MNLTTSKLISDKAQAAGLLAVKLAKFKNGNAVVVGIGPGGSSLGSMLAKELNLAFEVVLSQLIRHPANRENIIGSVSDNMVVLNENIQDIPESYLMRQVAKLQFDIQNDYRIIYGSCLRPSFSYKTVIAVGDILPKSNYLMAGLKVIKAQNPLKMIVAVPVVEPSAASEISRIADDLSFIHICSGKAVERDIYDNCNAIDLSEMRKSITSVNRESWMKTSA